MASDSQTAEQVTELLQNLNVDSQTNVGDTPEVAAGDASDCGVEDSALSGVSYMAVGPYEGYFDTGIYYAPNYYAMPHGFYYGGYEYPLGDWDDYSQHARTDGLDAEAPGNDCYGVYNENGTLLYQAGGFEYAQHMYGSYTPNAPILGNGQLYGPAYPYHGHIYQQPVASSRQLLSSASPVDAPSTSSRQLLSSASPVDAPSITAGSNNPVVDSTKGSLMNENNAALGPRPTYPVTAVPSTGPYVQTTLATSFPVPVSQDGHTGFHWSEGSKSMEGQQRHAISQPLTVTGPLGQTLQAGSRMPTHMSAGRPHFPCNVAPLPGSFSRFYQSPARAFSGFASGRGQGLRFNGFGPRGNGYSWIAEKGKARGRGAGSISNGTGDLDVLNEQNRGPRTSRIRNQQILPGTFRLIKGQDSMFSGGHDALGTSFSKDQCNRSDFSTNYESAKFFVIKSYSEDDIHKSVKYNVWASTPNGNKKLDAAYQEAQEKTGHCPVFLFFSVNASGQFCGVAEMVGSVDFSKSMDFWQQDKWNGRFPVKWHIIKDVPNNQFRHIILANNDNKPVTNSRDTQEVNFEQGIEMLKLFKNYLLKTSILDDFQFYENRQIAMQEKKARRMLHTQPQLMVPHGSGNESDSNKGTSSILENEHLENEQQQDNSCKLKDSQLASKSAMASNVISTDQRLVEKVPFTKAIAESESIKPSSKNKELDG